MTAFWIGAVKLRLFKLWKSSHVFTYCIFLGKILVSPLKKVNHGFRYCSLISISIYLRYASFSLTWVLAKARASIDAVKLFQIGLVLRRSLIFVAYQRPRRCSSSQRHLLNKWRITWRNGPDLKYHISRSLRTGRVWFEETILMFNSAFVIAATATAPS